MRILSDFFTALLAILLALAQMGTTVLIMLATIWLAIGMSRAIASDLLSVAAVVMVLAIGLAATSAWTGRWAG